MSSSVVVPGHVQNQVRQNTRRNQTHPAWRPRGKGNARADHEVSMWLTRQDPQWREWSQCDSTSFYCSADCSLLKVNGVLRYGHTLWACIGVTHRELKCSRIVLTHPCLWYFPTLSAIANSKLVNENFCRSRCMWWGRNRLAECMRAHTPTVFAPNS